MVVDRKIRCVLAATMGLGACVSAAPLAGTEWIVVEMNGEPVTVTSETPITLTFDRGGALRGQACNYIYGGYRAEDQRIVTGPIAMTEKLCGDAIGQLESQFVKILTGSNPYQFAPKGDLLIGPPGQPALRLRPR